jgi:ATP-dependent Clp protease ATP-binding subunit ClpB
MHTLVGAGSTEGSTDAANLMKPALARGEIMALGATTLAEFKRYIEKDAALERRFQPLIVEEPNAVNALSILRGLKSKYEIHHGVRISDDALRAAVELSTRYLIHRRLPDKAIDLVDEAASKLRLQMESVPAVLDELAARIAQYEMERSGLGTSSKNQKALQKINAALDEVKKEYAAVETIWRDHQSCLQRLKVLDKERDELVGMLEKSKQNSDFAFASRIQFEAMPRVETESKEIRKRIQAMQRTNRFLGREVGPREVANVVAVWTGIPVGALLEDDAEKLLTIEERLGRRVFGQTKAIEMVARAVKRAKVGVNDPKRPQGVFMFLGPTGVGKTELAKAIAADVFNDETKLIRIDMSEYMEAHNVARLIGAPPGYVGFGEGGELTEAVKLKPHSVILFDEIEKAHPKVLDILLQLLDEGRLTDAKGRLFDFRHTFIVLTSNIPLMSAHRGGSDTKYRQELSEHLRPELVNRIDEVVVFDKLNAKHFEFVVQRLLKELNERLSEREFRFVLGPTLLAELVKVGAQSEFGGRAVRRAFEMMVTDKVSDRILSVPHLCTGAWVLDLDSELQPSWQEDFQLHRYLPPARSG